MERKSTDHLIAILNRENEIGITDVHSKLTDIHEELGMLTNLVEAHGAATLQVPTSTHLYRLNFLDLYFL